MVPKIFATSNESMVVAHGSFMVAHGLGVGSGVGSVSSSSSSKGFGVGLNGSVTTVLRLPS